MNGTSPDGPVVGISRYHYVDALTTARELSPVEVKVALALTRFMGHGDCDEARPGWDLLEAATGRDRNTNDRAIKGLIGKHYLVQTVPGRTGQYATYAGAVPRRRWDPERDNGTRADGSPWPRGGVLMPDEYVAVLAERKRRRTADGSAAEVRHSAGSASELKHSVLQNCTTEPATVPQNCGTECFSSEAPTSTHIPEAGSSTKNDHLSLGEPAYDQPPVVEAGQGEREIISSEEAPKSERHTGKRPVDLFAAAGFAMTDRDIAEFAAWAKPVHKVRAFGPWLRRAADNGDLRDLVASWQGGKRLFGGTGATPPGGFMANRDGIYRHTPDEPTETTVTEMSIDEWRNEDNADRIVCSDHPAALKRPDGSCSACPAPEPIEPEPTWSSFVRPAASSWSPVPHMPDRCGECDQNRMKTNYEGRLYRCPACHPLATRAA